MLLSFYASIICFTALSLCSYVCFVISWNLDQFWFLISLIPPRYLGLNSNIPSTRCLKSEVKLNLLSAS
jgi:hypothetical protein